jgi:nitrate reductase NapAB chaperone NapD
MRSVELLDAFNSRTVVVLQSYRNDEIENHTLSLKQYTVILQSSLRYESITINSCNER